MPDNVIRYVANRIPSLGPHWRTAALRRLGRVHGCGGRDLRHAVDLRSSGLLAVQQGRDPYQAARDGVASIAADFMVLVVVSAVLACTVGIAIVIAALRRAT